MAMAEKRKGKAKKIILISVLTFVGLYVIGGTLAGIIVPKAIFGGQGEKTASLDKISFKIYKQRKDYDLMNVREVHHFESDGNKLTGYLYGKDFGNGTILHAHGMNLMSDAHESAIANYYLEHSYRVFMVDLTASGESEGNDMRSLSQSAHDVKAAYQYLQRSGLIQGKLILSGYSWGAHGVAKAFADGVPADKLVAFSGYDSPYDEMVAMAGRRSANVSYITVPTFALGVVMSQGSEVFEKASDKLKSQSEKCFFVHGTSDGTVFYNVSIAKAMKDTNATIHLTDDTHLTPWFSRAARDYYRNDVEPRLKQVKPGEEEAFLSTVDKEKTSELDASLFEEILSFLQKP